MKKLIKILVFINLIYLTFLLGWTGYHQVQDEQTNIYHRFQTKDGFNWRGLFSPLQSESQKIVTDSQQFSFRVYYPLAPNFQIIPPRDTTEKYVARRIKEVIEDSLKKMDIHYGLDYDGSSEDVRAYQKPTLVHPSDPKLYLHLTGTASPEAFKYGLKESVQPGHLEEENSLLAKSRLARTAKILEQFGYKADSMSSLEIQFPDTVSANRSLENGGVLDSMRYVQADVNLVLERVRVETKTSPLFVPVWLLASLLLFSWLRSRNRIYVKKPNLFPIFEAIKYILIAVLISGLIIFFWFLFLIYPIIYLIILSIFGIVVLIYLLIFLIRKFEFISKSFIKFLRELLRLLILIPRYISILLKKIKKIFQMFWRRFLICWRVLTPCWKRVFIVMTFIIVVLMSIVIYLV